MVDVEQIFLEAKIGRALKHNRLRAGLTQVQLARAISRSGKFLSEVESGKARITPRDLERLADALGISSERIIEDVGQPDTNGWQLPRRVREVQPTGMAIMSFTQLICHLDSAGWLRNAKLWSICAEKFPEENDVALVEQIASLVVSKNISLRYVFDAERLDERTRADLVRTQGTFDALPEPLIGALRWSEAMRSSVDAGSDRIVGYAADGGIPVFAQGGPLLWVETEDVSWSDVMPLLYCRSVTRSFENPNESVVFWYHLPRESGSKLLLDLAGELKKLTQRPASG